jgi:CO/xanthine dehydrogenase Mo-binding subunit
VAEKFPAAVKAAQALKVQVDPGPYGGLGSNDLFAEFRQKTRDPAAGSNWVLEGDVDKALAGAEKVLEMEYTTDMVCHATMEPLNATVQFVDGAWHVYSGTQSTSFARMTLTAYLSKVLGQKPEDIKIYVHESRLRRQAGLRRDPSGGVLRQGSRPPGQADPDPRVDVRNQFRANADLPQT